MSQDPFVQSLRNQIVAIDSKILAALNDRIGLVKRFKDYKVIRRLLAGC